MTRLLMTIAAALLMGWTSPALAQGQQDPAAATPPAATANPSAEAAAGADPAAGAEAATDAEAAAGADPAAAATDSAPAAGDTLRTQCEAELRRNDAWRADLRGQLARSILEEAPEPGDAQWRAELKRELAAEVHEEDAQAMLTNKRHVVMAYAALWLLVLGFAVFLWVRQRNLKDAIARLEREIEQATAND